MLARNRRDRKCQPRNAFQFSARTTEKLLTEYHKAVAELRTEVETWAKQPPEQRITPFFLKEWENSFRRRHKRNPSDEERQARVEGLMADVRTPEAEFKHRLAILRSQFVQKGHEHGIYDSDSLDTAPTP
jgi:hypothetical protein